MRQCPECKFSATAVGRNARGAIYRCTRGHVFQAPEPTEGFAAFGTAKAEAYARRTDPATSHDAAKAVAGKLTSLEAAVVEALNEIGPATSKEVAAHLGQDPWSISPRFAPLKRRGLIVRTGQKRERADLWAAADR